MVVAVLGSVFATPGPAWAGGPDIKLNPDSGGPGTPVTITGGGFCGSGGCSPLRLTFSGQPFGADLQPDGDGGFRSTAQAPGGLVPGSHEVIATQTLADGNEVRASAEFTYSPSRGEEAEREAETRDLITNLENPSAPPPKPRGVPLSAIASTPSESQPADSSLPSDGTSATRAGRGIARPDRTAAAASIGGIAVIITVAWLIYRRRRTTREAS